MQTAYYKLQDKYCILLSAHCILYHNIDTVHWTLHTTHYKLHIAYWRPHTTVCLIVSNQHCILHNKHWKLYIENWTLDIRHLLLLQNHIVFSQYPNINVTALHLPNSSIPYFPVSYGYFSKPIYKTSLTKCLELISLQFQIFLSLLRPAPCSSQVIWTFQFGLSAVRGIQNKYVFSSI